MKVFDNKNNSNFSKDRDIPKKKKIKKKKTRKDRLKERLQPKSTVVPFTNDFLNNFCRSNNIPVFQEKWHFKKND